MPFLMSLIRAACGRPQYSIRLVLTMVFCIVTSETPFGSRFIVTTISAD